MKPGQFWSYNGQLLRVKRRTNGCQGCLYEKRIWCPNTVIKGSHSDVPHCIENDIIFTNP